jgi:hypothetical protein
VVYLSHESLGTVYTAPSRRQLLFSHYACLLSVVSFVYEWTSLRPWADKKSLNSVFDSTQERFCVHGGYFSARFLCRVYVCRPSYNSASQHVLSACMCPDQSRGSSVGITSGYGVPGGGEDFLLSVTSRPVMGPTSPPIQWVPRDFSPEVKLPGREADHSPPTNVEVKKMWIYTPTPPYTLIA